MQAMLSPDLELNRGFSRGLNLVRKAVSEPSSIVEKQRLSLKNRKEKMPCNQLHARQFDEDKLTDLAEHQMHAKGVHKCCQCAYNSGYNQGSLLQTFISLDIDSLGDAHERSDGRYKSVHQAFSLGYSDGVNSFIKS